MKKKIILISLVVIVGLSAFGLWAFRHGNRSDPSRIMLSGNIELTKVNIAFKTAGKLIEINVREGSPVKKGMIVARLDREQGLHQLARSQAVLASAEAQKAQLQTAIQWQKETLAGQGEQAQAEVNQAEARLRELLAGARRQEIEQARAVVAAAQTEFERSKKDWERGQMLHKNEDISTSQYDQFKSRYEGAAAALKQAEERLAMVIEGPRKEDIEIARAQVARAKAGAQMVQANRLELTRKQQELETRRAEIARAQAEVALIESQLEDTVAVSPIDGVVLVKSAEAGETLAAGTPVVTAGDLDHPWLRGYINETALGRVKLGAKAKVTTDSYAGKAYWGRVSHISSEAEFTPKQIQTPEERVKLVYRIKIEIDNPNHELKSNMPADAEIFLDQ